MIGRHLLRKMDKESNHVTALVRKLPPETQTIRGVTYIELPMERYREIGEFINACDVFIPLAWAGSRREELDNERKNRFSFETVRDTAVYLIEKRGCRKVILPGSHHEYSRSGQPIDEMSDENPSLAYGAFRLKLYRTLCNYCERYDARCIELRLFSVYGEDAAEDKMINRTLGKLTRDESIVLKQGEQVYSFLYVDDAADAFIKVLNAEPCPSGHYNVSSNCHMQLKEFVKQMKEIAGSRSNIIIGNEAEKVHTIILSGKMSDVFDWKPHVDFCTGVEKMLSYYRRG